jgi:hypothetical protein
MEPWDGPATVLFSDGRCIGAVLDRNGLRPSRYTITHDGLVVLASETGVLDIAPERVRLKGRLEPGRMFLVGPGGRPPDWRRGDQGRGQRPAPLSPLDCRKPITLERIARRRNPGRPPTDRLCQRLQLQLRLGRAVPLDIASTRRQHLFGYTLEDLKMILLPMAVEGKEPVGSMGDDIPPAILSRRGRLLYDYFKQLFAQVTNPPLDAIREALVTSLQHLSGRRTQPARGVGRHCRRLKLESPVLTNSQLAALRAATVPDIRAVTLGMCFAVQIGPGGLAHGMAQLCRRPPTRSGTAPPC